jgi:radical SAM protein with 4Fe4S-binding SPASM domain
MGVELRPLGVNCNIGCQYCYQNPQRDAGNLTRAYDMEAMKAAVLSEGGSFILFGGEPLLMPEGDLESLWAWGLEKFGQNGVQTNGTLINENHVRMFRQYKVHVGISVDGPGELNDVRWAGSLEKTRAATARTEEAIELLCREGMPPSLIVTLHRNNATADKLPLMHEWLRKLDGAGVASVRLHMLEVEGDVIRRKYALTAPESIAALRSFDELEKQLGRLRFDVFEDIEKLLLGQDEQATCVWMACDPYTTAAVQGVEGSGRRSNCGRTNKDGVDFTKADSPGYERYVALYHTPQEYGGCQGCRFFLVCKGQCPGTAIDGDWRNRTEHCEVWKRLFRDVEERLLDKGHFPVSVQPNRVYLEQEMLGAWAAGRNPTMRQTIEAMYAKLQGAQ